MWIMGGCSEILNWALDEDPVVSVTGPGVVDVTVWRQAGSMTVHLVNLTNPMMMKGPFRELIPVAARVAIRVPVGTPVSGVKLLMSGLKPAFENKNGILTLSVPSVLDHEIVAVDFA